MAHLYLSAAHKSSGKTTLMLGLCRAFSDRGLSVQPFKKGPDYIDPIWHGLAAGRPSYNLDFHMMCDAEIEALFVRHTAKADIALIEGNKGLYDGMDVEGSNSNAALAKRLRAPVVLVLDTQGMTRGVAPLLLGYQAFDTEVNIAGVILNKVGGPRHESKLREAIERYTDIPVLGAVRTNSALAIVERHLGLMPGNESTEAEARIAGISKQVSEQVDLEALRTVAQAASYLPSAPGLVANPLPVTDGHVLRLAYAHDRAFGFYYQEDLDSLRAAGVTLHPFNTLLDTHLPGCDGLLIGGGFPEMFIEALAANGRLRNAILLAIEAGLPVYAECGGLMYLTRSLTWNSSRGAMVAALPADCVMGERPVGRGYAVLEPTDDAPWPAQTTTIPAHEFHYSHLENLPADVRYAYRVVRGHGIDGEHDGLMYKGVLASYCHRRGSGAQGWIGPLLERMRAAKKISHQVLRAA